MITARIQKSIRQSYQNLQAQMENFTPRRGQNYLVAEIAKTLCGTYHPKNRLLVAEAGTGIGKSLSYLMGAVPVAVLNNKKLIIATATVALQEQLLHKDLPLYRRLTDLDFQFRIAKGRQRYCCAEKLAAICEPETSSGQVALFESPPTPQDISLYKEMYSQWVTGKWDGDRDSWPNPVEEQQWRQIVSDKHSCNPSFAMHHHCPFQKARSTLEQADVIIANHSLVMADADLGGGIILPEPENTIYIFDEAHHLPQVARDYAAASSTLKNTAIWLEKFHQSMTKWAQLTDESRISRFRDEIASAIQVLIPTLTQLSQQFTPEQCQDGVLRFEHGELPEWLFEESKSLKRAATKINQATAKVADLISERLQEGQISHRIASPVLAELGVSLQRLENMVQVWTLMAEPPRTSGAPMARWVTQTEGSPGDYTVHVSPIEIGWKLDQQLWSRCYGTIAVSATLRALNSFTFFCHQSGISSQPDEGTQFIALASPFDYNRQGELYIPRVRQEPQSPHYTRELIEQLPQLIPEKKATLVLFSSYWQMNQVAEQLQPDFKKRGWLLQVQGKKSRTEILNVHRFTVELQGTSVIFGTGSFSEGLDLPGQLLENVIITKIPFSVPTSPIEQAHAEYILSKGGNPFMQITVPEASRKLIQCVGRLLRNEKDSGRVVILDRRVVTKQYGKALLDALPPFKRIIDQ
ncbi:ATP-dependent DNA helicase DinG [Vibrio mangrovi]|uniref:ATP-dependent DNA helicase DinG n=1 Tax=Vibrio mangrovi TaxID=474394 RepID=A0A1Y6IRS5_9VIBR|nr:ATP-dependent DNA helicase DinG [Vibrio mangrovi]MDW6003708.1 ATP-dependent DNA helicase DinG [Vibrio mangrovi]SMR99500.1 putative ATP-dependent helicase DinG [Vibrio mangrovi]